MVRADLHVGLALVEAAGSDVQQGEIVWLRETRHRFEDLGEAGDVFELLGELTEEAVDVHSHMQPGCSATWLQL